MPSNTSSPPAPPSPVASEIGDDEAVAQEALELINARRAEAGCEPLTAHEALLQAARRHSRDMAANDFLDHTGSDGSDTGQRIAETGYRYAPTGPDEPIWAENVAVGYQSAEAVVTGWMASEGHRRNILTCSFRMIGIAVARRANSTYGTYWTADFASAPAP